MLAGFTPVALTVPFVGLKPTSPLNSAGTRIEPAVSDPSENDARETETVTDDPLLEPPTI